MKLTILERFKSVISAKSNSNSDFAKKIGVAQTTFSNQLKSPRGISAEVLQLTLEQFPDVSAEWLLRGKGEMLLSDNLPKFHGEETDTELSIHAMLTRVSTERDELIKEVMELRDKVKEQKGCIEWQKDFISDLVVEKHELEKLIPQQQKKEDIV